MEGERRKDLSIDGVQSHVVPLDNQPLAIALAPHLPEDRIGGATAGHQIFPEGQDRRLQRCIGQIAVIRRGIWAVERDHAVGADVQLVVDRLEILEREGIAGDRIGQVGAGDQDRTVIDPADRRVLSKVGVLATDGGDGLR